MNILVTGANGFVGTELCRTLTSLGHSVTGCVRNDANESLIVDKVFSADINTPTNWGSALQDCEVVVHLAARAHLTKDVATDPLLEFRRINVDATLELANQCLEAGVRRFIFVSSIGVNGAETKKAPFRFSDPPDPHSPYAVSKYEAEVALRKLCKTSMELVIIRPPLVYGPGAPGNLGTIERVMNKGFPMPFGAVKNRRTLIALENLIDLLVLCLDHRNAVSETLLASDGVDLSTSEIVALVGKLAGEKAIQIRVPASWLEVFLNILGKQSIRQSLLGDLRVDNSATQRLLDWEVPFNPRNFLQESD
jgi:nucleoside-diphosphate-sugar epimerase